MSRAVRRLLNRATKCALCREPMAPDDRVIRRPTNCLADQAPAPDVAHPACVERDAQERTARAEAAVANMLRVAAKIETAQRAARIGLWVPSSEAPASELTEPRRFEYVSGSPINKETM